MGQAYFYHLTSSPLEATLPMLIAKAREAGWRIVLRGTGQERVEWLDQYLWLHPKDGFLPHGIAGGAHDADQPVLLSAGQEMGNSPDCLMAFDGAGVSATEVEGLARVCILFDGNDAKALQAARDQWRMLTEAGCTAQYWAQDDGRWVKKAESGS